MAVTPLRLLLFLGGATAAALGVAYYTGALDPVLGTREAAAPSASITAPASQPEAPAPDLPKADEPKPEQQAALPSAAESPPKQEEPPAAAQSEPLPPSFDVLRVEPDGSIVIAGRAAPNAEVEILSGSKVLGKVTATGDGEFAAALDDPLKPGDYQIVLRSTTPSRVVANSKETAIVSIPETKDGQVLALVEQPGAPSRLITKPEATTPPEPKPPVETPAEPATPPVAQGTAPTGQAANAEPTAPAPKAGRPAAGVKVAVDAVEIEGRKIFVAGSSEPGKTVRIYANDILLGDAKTSPEGRFLIEAERDLPVGDYVVRADVLGPDGAKVIARAAVPFSREPGENIAAVAPQEPAAPGPAAPMPQPERSPPSDTSTAEVAPATDAGAQPSAGVVAPASGSTKPQTGTDVTAPEQAEPQTPQQAPSSEEAGLAPKLKPVDGSVIIRRGDSLWRISKRVYGRGVRYSTIYLANQQQIKDPDMIWPGQIFRVPEKTDEGEKADMKAIEPPPPSTVQ
ncbi:MAG: LysM peptidoglycan-binding domain-containing protein [Rhizobiaceae bacterium]|nr:LysM peptidoglycan-binding domain-containing protein [Rhizobiaceae bacterium]